jgi:predicted site-specific integrase-resolvase
MSKVKKNLLSIYIPANFYVNKTQAAKFLQINKSTLQYHINAGHIETINFPDLGHLIKEEDIRNFVPAPQGKPSIYRKVK